MLSLENIYTLYFGLYFQLCICLNKLSINIIEKIVLFIIEFKTSYLYILVFENFHIIQLYSFYLKHDTYY